MTMERSALIMDQIFSSPDEDGKGRLLKIIHDFLVSEAEKHSALEKGQIISVSIGICCSNLESCINRTI